MIWIAIAVMYIFYVSMKKNLLFKEMWKSCINLFKLTIIQFFIITNVSVIVCIYIVTYSFKLNISYWFIKDYLLTFIFLVFPIVVKLKENSLLFELKNKMRNIMSLFVLIVFIGGNYTQNLFVEFLLVGIIIFTSVVETIITDEKIKGCSRNILNVIGWYMLIGGFVLYYKSASDIFTLDFWIPYFMEWIVVSLNIPILIIIQKLLYIEGIVINSKYNNGIFTYIRYFINRLKAKKVYKQLNFKDYIVAQGVELKEIKILQSYGIRFLLKDSNYFSEMEIKKLIGSAIVNIKKYHRIKEKKLNYPIVIEVRDKESFNLIAFWKDEFISEDLPYIKNIYFSGKNKEIYKGIFVKPK